jgi:preprotein translocase subunit YajC
MISVAHAQAAPAAPGIIDQFLQGPLLLVGILVLMYFVLMRPQMKRAKEHRQMVAGLQKGDEVVASGGTLGKVTNVTEHYVKVEIAPAVEITVQKASIQTLLPKGTIKSAS